MQVREVSELLYVDRSQHRIGEPCFHSAQDTIMHLALSDYRYSCSFTLLEGLDNERCHKLGALIVFNQYTSGLRFTHYPMIDSLSAEKAHCQVKPRTRA